MKYYETDIVKKSRSNRLPKDGVVTIGTLEFSSAEAWQLYKSILCINVGSNSQRVAKFLSDFCLAYENYYRVINGE